LLKNIIIGLIIYIFDFLSIIFHFISIGRRKDREEPHKIMRFFSKNQYRLYFERVYKKMENILQNATITLKNKEKQLFEAILISQKGIYIGVINKSYDGKKKFEEHRFIPKEQIEKISFLNEEGKQQDIDYFNGGRNK